ncbi:MAG TPA: MFS transporter [Ktedonobacterales bacterium]|jgi:MFS family permease|nr:MFS transporter [Ktedonobacterales bacterium]
MTALKSSPQDPSLPGDVALWRNRDYLLLWSGQAVSSIGSQLSQLALPLFVLAFSGSAVWAGVSSGLRSIPYVVLSLPAGALADRWNRKRIMLVCDSIRAICLASIPIAAVTGTLSLLQLCLVSLLEGACFVFFNVAEAACLPRVVTHEQLKTAASVKETTDNTSYTIGPFLGGILYGIGQAVPFLFDAVSYLLSVLSLFFIKQEFQEQHTEAPRNLWREIREGLLWLWRHPVLRFVAFLSSVGMFTDWGTVLIVLVIATKVHAEASAIGLIFGIAGIGGIIGSLIAAPLQRRFRFGQLMAGTYWFWALLMPLYLLAPNVLVLGVITALTFTLGSVYTVAQFSYRLAVIPDALQGRVNSVFRLAAFLGPPLGSVVTGALLQIVGVTPTVLIYTALLVGVSLLATFNKPLRKIS